MIVEDNLIKKYILTVLTGHLGDFFTNCVADKTYHGVIRQISGLPQNPKPCKTIGEAQGK